MYSWPTSVCWLQEVPHELHWPMTVYICSHWFDSQQYHKYHVICSLCKKWQTTQAFVQDVATIILLEWFFLHRNRMGKTNHKYTNTSFSAASTIVYRQLATTGKSGSFNRPCRWQMIIFISITSVLATHLRGIDCSEFYGCSSWPIFRKAPEQEKVFATVHAIH